MYSARLQSELNRKVHNIAAPGSDVCGYQEIAKILSNDAGRNAAIVGLVLEYDLKSYCWQEPGDSARHFREFDTQEFFIQRLICTPTLYNF